MPAWLARKLSSHDRRLTAVETASELAHSSIEDGAISGFDRGGNPTVEVGRQHDGTHTSVSLTGPKPPTPYFPSASAVPGVVEVRWNGKFAGDASSPMDFKHTAAYVVPVGSIVDLSDQSGVMTGELGDVVQVQAAAGVHDVYLAAWTLSGKVSDLAGPVSVVVPVVADGGLLNGKMTVADRAPTVEDGAGKPENALWNQIDPDTDGQVAVWRWDGTAWVDMPITETMLPLVNIAEGTYGRLQGVQLEADAIDGQVITGAVIQSPGDGAGYQLTENGYTSRDEDGNVTVRLPADGSTAQFRGDLEAKSLTASGRVSFQAPENEITSGAALVLESGVQAPASAPTVGTVYETVQFPTPPERANVSGLAYAAGLWWRGVNVLGTAEGDRLEGINDDGEIVVTRSITGDPRGGVTAIGDTVYVLVKRHNKPENDRYVFSFDVSAPDQPYTGGFQYTTYGTGTYQPGIGTDGTNVLIAQCEKGGNLNWSRWNKTTGAFMDDVNTLYPLKSDVVGIYKGAADFGSTRVAVTRDDGTTNVFASSGTNIDGVGWRPAKDGRAVGLAFVGGKFYHQTTESRLVAYTGFTDSAGDTNDWWVSQTLVGPSGEETLASSPQRFTFMRRSGLQLSGSDMPPGVVGSKFYLARKGTKPGRADFHLLETVSGKTARVDVLPTDWATRATPPTVNTFPESSPAILKSRIGGYEVRGDGSGTWGPLTFNADGTMSSSQVPAWVPITTFFPGYSPQTWSFVPAYRIWPDRKVELRGVVAGAIPGSASAPLFTLPPEAAPTKGVEFVTATNGGAWGMTRVELGNPSARGEFRVYPPTTGVTWVSLDSVFYYLE